MLLSRHRFALDPGGRPGTPALRGQSSTAGRGRDHSRRGHQRWFLPSCGLSSADKPEVTRPGWRSGRLFKPACLSIGPSAHHPNFELCAIAGSGV
jgi:hypothetical protein